jgi:hypothetical protein
MTKYKTARDEAASVSTISAFTGEIIPKYYVNNFKRGADFATRYWLTESEDVKNLIKAVSETYHGVQQKEGCAICEALEAFTKLIESIGDKE